MQSTLALIPALLMAVALVGLIVYAVKHRKERLPKPSWSQITEGHRRARANGADTFKGRKAAVNAVIVEDLKNPKPRKPHKPGSFYRKFVLVVLVVGTTWTLFAAGIGAAIGFAILVGIQFAVISLVFGALKLGAKYVTTDHEADKAIIAMARKEGAIK